MHDEPNEPNQRVASHAPAQRPTSTSDVVVVAPVPFRPRLKESVSSFFRRHGRKLWWLHSAYALALGTTVVVVAQKGFEHSRWLAVSLGIAWLLVVVFFRVFGSGKGQLDGAAPKTRASFFAMTYALKNLYQGMLFFLLPFYFKSTTFDSYNFWFVLLLGACAILSTLDIVFDRVLFRFRSLASLFHGIALFGCLNLVIPALFPNTRTLFSLLSAAAITVVGFWTIHVQVRWLKRRSTLALFAATIVAAVFVAYGARRAVPPVPMYLSRAAVGPTVEGDGRLAMEVKTLRPSVVQQLIAVTDIVVPGGTGDRLHHVWRHEGREVLRATEDTSRVPGPSGTVRLRSTLAGKRLSISSPPLRGDPSISSPPLRGDPSISSPPLRGDPSIALEGRWSLDVETEDGQLVGRTTFTVAE